MPGPAVLLFHVGKTNHEGDSDRIVLRNISVAIAPGEIAVLVGRSGSGKFTLLNLIAGIDHPTAAFRHCGMPEWRRGPSATISPASPPSGRPRSR